MKRRFFLIFLPNIMGVLNEKRCKKMIYDVNIYNSFLNRRTSISLPVKENINLISSSD
jgi:hypothetical protein